MIMAGGSGTRLWPLSRQDRPKQLIPLVNGKSLLALATERIAHSIPPDRQWLCTGATHAPYISETLGFPREQIIGEPIGRDTLNAVALSAAVIARQDPNAVMTVLTADHLIDPVSEFTNAVNLGYALVENDPRRLISFVIQPDHPHTGFGYVEKGDPVDESAGEVESAAAWNAIKYTEKPDLEVARQFVASGRHGWSSGMFCFHVQTFLDTCRTLQPVTWEGITEIAAAWGTPQHLPVISRVYPSLKKISVDYAIMEPASRDPDIPVLAVDMNVNWLDVGSWSSLATTVAETDREHHNRVRGEAVLSECRDMLVINESTDGHLVTAIGCRDLIVVHTPDATLICPKDKAQDVRTLAERVAQRYR